MHLTTAPPACRPLTHLPCFPPLSTGICWTQEGVPEQPVFERAPHGTLGDLLPVLHAPGATVGWAG